jgi:flavin reductase (DIM6/NTAB) family NADH-FMN oxidoreductase RutF
VLVCVDKSTHTYGIMERGRAFTVNVLHAGQEDVSRLFATKAPPEPGTLRGRPFRIGQTGAPILEDSLAYLECRVTQILEGGDHSIFLGEVMSQSADPKREPLIFFRGRYRALAP